MKDKLHAGDKIKSRWPEPPFRLYHSCVFLRIKDTLLCDGPHVPPRVCLSVHSGKHLGSCVMWGLSWLAVDLARTSCTNEGL